MGTGSVEKLQVHRWSNYFSVFWSFGVLVFRCFGFRCFGIRCFGFSVFWPDTKSNIIMSNHRCITITSTLGKTYEHILKNKIGPLPQSALQFGFTEGLCPQMAALCLTESISEAKANRSSLVVARLDPEKAFNVVFHPMLFLDLSKKGRRALPKTYGLQWKTCTNASVKQYAGKTHTAESIQ